MSDEIPSGRLSQIFESLSCLGELQQRQVYSPSQSSSLLASVPSSTNAQSVSHNYYIRHPDGSGYYLSSGTQTFPSASSQSHHLIQHQQYNLQQDYRSRCNSVSLTSSPLMAKRATSFSGQIPLTSTQGTRVQSAAAVVGGGVVTTAAAAIQEQQTSQSTPNSPRLMPRRSHKAPPIPAKPNAALIASPALMAMDADAPWPNFSSLTDHLDVHQVNNYAQAVPEINWQERCLELQLELHRSKNQAGRIRDMLREKVWIDLKCKTKKKKTENKSEISATGGGPNRIHHFTDIEETIIRILNLDTCVDPPGQEFGFVDIVTHEKSEEVNFENSFASEELPCSSQKRGSSNKENLNKSSKAEKLQEERRALLHEQTSSQNNFYENMIGFVKEIKSSMKNIEYYSKKNARNIEEILKLKKEKLKVYKEVEKNKAHCNKEKLKLKVKLLELETQKQNLLDF